jgi:hypothetical protein
MKLIIKEGPSLIGYSFINLLKTKNGIEILLLLDLKKEIKELLKKETY